MGRNKKYHTDEEIRIANSKKRMRYYNKHKEIVKAKNLKAYHDKKNGNQLLEWEI